MKLLLASLLILPVLYAWRRQRRPKPLSQLRRDEDRMSPAWIVENVYRCGKDGDAL
jgi:hypothetical protein